MQVLWNEMKKIMSWKLLLLVAVVNGLLYFLLIDFEIKHFPNGRPALDSYRIGIEMIERYGATMDEEEMDDFKRLYEEEVKKADAYLQAREEYVEAGLDTYEKLRAYNPFELQDAHKEELRNQLFETTDLFWELQERERLIDFHEAREDMIKAYRADGTPQQQARYDEMLAFGLYQVYPEVAWDNFKRFIHAVALTIVVSVVITVSPLFIKDRLGRQLGLYYTTAVGRKLYRTKLLAGFISMFLVVTGLLVLYFTLYASNHISPYYDVPIHAFISEFSWYDPTFFQYIVLSIVAIYVLSAVMTVLSMLFSTIMPNYVTLIGVQIPVVIAMLGYGLELLLTRMMSIFTPQYIVPAVYSSLAIISVVTVLYLWSRERKRDILIE